MLELGVFIVNLILPELFNLILIFVETTHFICLHSFCVTLIHHCHQTDRDCISHEGQLSHVSHRIVGYRLIYRYTLWCGMVWHCVMKSVLSQVLVWCTAAACVSVTGIAMYVQWRIVSHHMVAGTRVWLSEVWQGDNLEPRPITGSPRLCLLYIGMLYLFVWLFEMSAGY